MNKTPEEIEKLCYALCQSESIVDEFGKPTKDGLYIAKTAYEKCQADNAERKYTEADMLGFANRYTDYDVDKKDLTEFLTSLNK